MMIDCLRGVGINRQELNHQSQKNQWLLVLECVPHLIFWQLKDNNHNPGNEIWSDFGPQFMSLAVNAALRLHFIFIHVFIRATCFFKSLVSDEQFKAYREKFFLQISGFYDGRWSAVQ